MRSPRPYIVTQRGNFVCIVHARSLEAVQAIITARLSDTTGIVISATSTVEAAR